MKKKVLIVEDEDKIADIVKAYLENEGFDAYICKNGVQVIDTFSNKSFDVVILDLMLPGISGEEICKRLRTFSNVPIIMLTAKSDEESKLEGFALGADDYITKPFSPRELVSRVKALLRRTESKSSILADIISFNNDLEIDIRRQEVRKNNKLVYLTPNEYKILLTLASNPNQVFSREVLIETAFGFDYDGFYRTIDTHIKNIRQKIEDNPKSPKYIKTVYGVGYKFGGSNET
ncbi:Transcriptional regulatory protein, C terminal [Alkalithermobacter thermoalcaliphilus JW-YL-7 = DSM 7308]|uniref:Stage 0 sporulation protein A homolog n=1 Tax=Alkalithermobacter thermoalcaliphilus JW-YL-7 = DSM 7308 TaxID=1121328 RepID=A0A150FT85_CLOPD|nr:two component transcriptional regulator, winged helix family [[Clostridium] paradoxum JW-YL-7 = DSM 7308]SHK35059.1 Transcriptional regulatory protein, C terminal [[Clostridium] paradoxum JW-YL-7 = DSM 7308]